jgi:hypothetical protein
MRNKSCGYDATSTYKCTTTNLVVMIVSVQIHLPSAAKTISRSPAETASAVASAENEDVMDVSSSAAAAARPAEM